jgi:predicted alpha/beta-hydrolase family hydrolase
VPVPHPAVSVAAVDRRRSSWLLGLLALLLTVPATVALARADDGLAVTTAEVGPVPVTVLDADPATPSPVVVVAHGFAGSTPLMGDLATALARAGYAAVRFDVTGHGAHPDRLPLVDRAGDTDVLDADLAAVVGWARSQPWADDGQVGLVGHSMGAGMVTRYAVADATGDQAVGATVAISLPDAGDLPTGEPSVPRNLALLVGSAEPERFLDAAAQGMAAAYPGLGLGLGDSTGAADEGTAREAREVPRADHVTILFSSTTAQAVVDWMDTTVGAPTSGSTVGGGRAPWLLVLTVGAAIGFVPLARLAFGRDGAEPTPARRNAADPHVDDPVAGAPPRALLAWGISAGAAVAASLVALVARPLAEVVPLAVGGHVLVWFAAAGALIHVVLQVRARRAPRVPPTVSLNEPFPGFPWRDLGAAFAMTSYAVAVLVLVGRETWSSFAFVGDRPRWLLLVELALLTWFWADDRLVGRRWWLGVATRVTVVAVLIASVPVLGAPGFLTLIAPLTGAVLLLVLVYGQTVTRLARLEWAPALVQAIPLAYVVTTTFPLVG